MLVWQSLHAAEIDAFAGATQRQRHRALGQHHKPAEHDHHDEDRQQPELLADPHEGPQLGEDAELLEFINGTDDLWIVH